VEKIWLKNYDDGVPAEVNTHQYKSLVDYLENSFKKFSHRPAFANMGYKLTYAEIDQKSRDFAAYLQNGLGLKKGDRFAIMLPNLLQYIIAMFAALRAGLIVVNVNPLYTTRELAHQLKDSGAKALLVLANFANVAQLALPSTDVEHVIITRIGDAFPTIKAKIVNFMVRYVKKMEPSWVIPGVHYFRDVLKAGEKLAFNSVDIGLYDIAYLQYTGGTTGVSKGAILTHHNLLSNIAQLDAWVKPYLNEDKQEIMVTALPLYHIFSLTVNCWTFLQEGAFNVLITNPRDIAGFIKEIKHLKFTTTTGVNTLFNALLSHPEFSKVDFSCLRFVLSGGMALQKKVSERWKALTGLNIVEGYGLTEASPVVSVPPLSVDYYTGSIGIPLPSSECAVMDDDGILPLGKEGELCVRGPQIMQGYWNRPDATAKVISKDGWLRTGDIARMNEEGYFFIVDRQKNMIVVSGFNVYPTEIEEVVSQMPEVSEVAAIGVPDERTGERVKLYVVKNNPELTAKQVIDYCYKELTRYKVPKDVEFRDELPKSNVGKILHRKLREENEAAMAAPKTDDSTKAP
jgi:long-chain acyl-CoA synthetase